MEPSTDYRPQKSILWVWECYLLLAALLPLTGSIVLFVVPFPGWMDWITLAAWIFTAIWVSLYLFFSVFFLPVYFKRMRYRMTVDRLEVHTGVIHTHYKVMPFSSVRYLTSFQGPLERRLGLTSVTLFATGSFVVLHGLSVRDCEALQKRILP